MPIEASIRANLIAAVTTARRWRSRPVHKDTADHWRQLIDYGRRLECQPSGEAVGELLTELDTEMAHIQVASSGL